MDGEKNYEISQDVQLLEGKYSLSLDCAARKGVDVGTSQLEIVWNGEVVRTVTPEDYQIAHVDLALDGKAGKNTLTLRGTGASDQYGISVDNVQLTDFVGSFTTTTTSSNSQSSESLAQNESSLTKDVEQGGSANNS
mgnify:CR=1 FL=1